jgi:25S rRNA (uracil2634-N3)-methyltransferase
MLVSFFKLSTALLAPHGTIIVTLFEGEPYTLWNIRDLARHSGLEVQRSFRFDASVYPGYAHSRTLGNLSGGGGWKGEDRLARSYVFQVKGAAELVQRQMVKVQNQRNHEGPGQARKRKAVDDSSDEDSDG